MEGSKQIQTIFFVLTTWTLVTSSRWLRLGTLGHNYGATRKHELCSRSGQVQIYRGCRGSSTLLLLALLRGSVAVLSAVSQLSASVSGGYGVFPVSQDLVRARSGGGDTNCSRLHSGLIKTRHTNCHHQLIISCKHQHRFFKQSQIIVLYDTCILPRYHAIVRTSQLPCTKQQ